MGCSWVAAHSGWGHIVSPRAQLVIFCVYVCVFRPELRGLSTDRLVRRHIMPSTSTPVGSRLQPAMVLSRGSTFSGFDSKLRSSARYRVNGDDSKAVNCSTIQFSPDKQHCSTPAGHGRRVAAASAGFLVQKELKPDASFSNESQCSTRVGRHLSMNRSPVACFDDRPQKPEKSSRSFLSGAGLSFLQKMSRHGSAHSASPDSSCSADVSSASVRRKSSFRDSFKRIFLSHRSA